MRPNFLIITANLLFLLIYIISIVSKRSSLLYSLYYKNDKDTVSVNVCECKYTLTKKHSVYMNGYRNKKIINVQNADCVIFSAYRVKICLNCVFQEYDQYIHCLVSISVMQILETDRISVRNVCCVIEKIIQRTFISRIYKVGCVIYIRFNMLNICKPFICQNKKILNNTHLSPSYVEPQKKKN